MARGNVLKPWYQSKTLTILVVLWALFTACLGIMIVVIFVQPHWISGKLPNKNVNFGLYRNCSDSLNDCSGSLNDFNNIYSAAWKASTVFVAMAFIATFLSVGIMLFYWLCCFESSGFGFRTSSGLQFSAGMLSVYTGLWQLLFLGQCFSGSLICLFRMLCNLFSFFEVHNTCLRWSYEFAFGLNRSQRGS